MRARAIAGVVIVIVSMLAPTLLLAAGERSHFLVREKGTVGFRDPNAAEWTDVISTRFVTSDQWVHTLADSKGHLQFFISYSDVARVALLSNVTLALERLSLDGGVREVTLSQRSGRIYVDARTSAGRHQQFTVRTPSATIAVRGTRFYSDVGADGTTRCGCADGRVDVTGAGVTVTLRAGYYTLVRPGQPPEAPRWDQEEFGPPPSRSRPFVVEWDPIFVPMPGRGFRRPPFPPGGPPGRGTPEGRPPAGPTQPPPGDGPSVPPGGSRGEGGTSDGPVRPPSGPTLPPINQDGGLR